MRIVHLGKYAYHARGGIESHVELLARLQAQAGHQVSVLGYDPSGDAQARWVDGVQVLPLAVRWQLGSQPFAPALRRQLRQLLPSADVLHLHAPDPLAHLLLSLAPRPQAWVMSWHVDIVGQRLLRPLYLQLAARVLRKPHAVVAGSDAVLHSPQLDAFAPRPRRHQVPYGIDTDALQPTPAVLAQAAALRERYRQRPLVFALGRHVVYKGFATLIEAMTRVPAVLLLGGAGPLRIPLEDQARISGASVDFCGDIAPQDLAAYYHACDVFCLPSIHRAESFGLVQAEAMACAKPIVNTSLGTGVNALAPDGVCALSVAPGDSAALAAALNALLSDPARAAQLGRSGHARLHEGFDARRMHTQMLQVYRQLLR